LYYVDPLIGTAPASTPGDLRNSNTGSKDEGQTFSGAGAPHCNIPLPYRLALIFPSRPLANSFINAFAPLHLCTSAPFNPPLL
jgi:hypothetical protein